MFNKFAAVLIAASLFTAPAFAQGTAASVNGKTGAQSTVTVKVIKKHTMKRNYKRAHVVKHVRVKHVRHAKRIRHHNHVVVKQVVTKPAIARTN